MTANNDAPNAPQAANAVSVGSIGRIVFLCSEGLTTDGAHHKQWALGEILKLVDEPKYHDYKNWLGDMGIAP